MRVIFRSVRFGPEPVDGILVHHKGECRLSAKKIESENTESPVELSEDSLAATSGGPTDDIEVTSFRPKLGGKDGLITVPDAQEVIKPCK